MQFEISEFEILSILQIGEDVRLLAELPELRRDMKRYI